MESHFDPHNLQLINGLGRGVTMSSFTKILLGALATVGVAWCLHGPMGFGANCAATVPTVDAAVTTAG